MLTEFKFFYQFFLSMQTVDKLYTNSTNRLPILPQPLFNIPLRTNLLQFSPASSSNMQIQALVTLHETLEQHLQQARQQQRMMQQLFDSMAKAEQGQAKFPKKLQRRCNKDILDRYYCTVQHCKRVYSSPTSLQRHVKIKHNSGKKEPPQLFADLPPEPNLTDKSEIEQESHCSLQLRRGEKGSTRELT